MFDPQDISIIDPGLMKRTGHHAGFAEALAGSLPASQDRHYRFFCHEALDDQLKATMEQVGMPAHPVFTINFYQHFNEITNSVEIYEYITTLCREYLEVFGKIRADKPGNGRALVYPCLGWEQAFALALAIQIDEQEQSDWQHLVCVMFNPGIDHQSKLVNSNHRMNFHLAFQALTRFHSVSLFASDEELRECYLHLLQREVDIELHPCYLSRWLPATEAREPPPGRRIILFLGDAKGDKGFNQLPQLIEDNLDLLGAADRFVVQYVHEWQKPEIQATIRWLEDFATRDPRLELHNSFWPENIMNQQIESADMVVLLHDSDAYQHKTSGLLWLVAWHQVPVVVTGDNWLFREANRLGLRATQLKQLDLGPAIKFASLARPDTSEQAEAYRQTIYEPFWHWLDQQFDDEQRYADAL
jgi:hypothetical protein